MRGFVQSEVYFKKILRAKIIILGGGGAIWCKSRDFTVCRYLVVVGVEKIRFYLKLHLRWLITAKMREPFRRQGCPWCSESQASTKQTGPATANSGRSDRGLRGRKGELANLHDHRPQTVAEEEEAQLNHRYHTSLPCKLGARRRKVLITNMIYDYTIDPVQCIYDYTELPITLREVQYQTVANAQSQQTELKCSSFFTWCMRSTQPTGWSPVGSGRPIPRRCPLIFHAIAEGETGQLHRRLQG